MYNAIISSITRIGLSNRVQLQTVAVLADEDAQQLRLKLGRWFCDHSDVEWNTVEIVENRMY